jgi:hypothetical protein
VRKRAFLFLLMLLLTGGCGSGKKPRFTKEQLADIPFPQRNGLPEGSGGFVLAVGYKTITADEIVMPLSAELSSTAQSSTFEVFSQQARERIDQVVTTRILNVLLYNEARKEAGEATEEAVEKLAEQQLQRFFDNFGGDVAKANEALKQMGMTRRSYKEYQKMMILNQSYAASKVPDNISITYGELLERYNEMKDESFSQEATIKFQLIDIEVARLQVTDANQSRRQSARDLADKLMRRMQAGEDVDKLAEEHQGVSLRIYNEPVRPESLMEPYDICAAQAEKMTAGEISPPIETETGERIFIIKLEEKRSEGFKPLEEVHRQIEKQIIAERRQKAVDELEAELLQQAEVGEKDAFVDFCLKKIYRMSNQ